MLNYLKIQEINFGELQEKKANAIIWDVVGLRRNVTEATVNCSLIYVLPNDRGTVESNYYFSMTIPNTVLQQWGADDTVIDDFVLTYSPLFIKDIN